MHDATGQRIRVEKLLVFLKSSQGGGLLLNRLASDVIQFFIKITPKISIDDALIGIIMKDRGSGTE